VAQTHPNPIPAARTRRFGAELSVVYSLNSSADISLSCENDKLLDGVEDGRRFRYSNQDNTGHLRPLEMRSKPSSTESTGPPMPDSVSPKLDLRGGFIQKCRITDKVYAETHDSRHGFTALGEEFQLCANYETND
jgi:hypothetical protein